MKGITKDKLIKLFITILLIQLPFLDMIRTTSFRHFEILGISLIELVNIVLIGVALIATILKLWKCDKKRNILYLFLYLILVLIYIILHCKHIITFDKSIFPKANFNFITETFYICRVYVLPLMLLYILCNNKDIFDKEFYVKIVKIVIAIISFSIIILNILKLSYISYSDKHNFITNNMFDYFLYSGDFRQLSVSSIFIYIVLTLLKKEERKLYFEKHLLFLTLILSAYMTISPFMLSRINEGTPDFSIKNTKAYTSLTKIDKNDKKDADKIFQKYKDEYLINEAYLKMYPFSGDSEFWLKMASRNKALNNNSRIMKSDIIKRVKERNNNKIDTYLGLGYTLNFMDVERDYVYQYYLFGIVGMLILMGPYFILLAYLIFKTLKNIKVNLKLNIILGFMSVVLGLSIAYLSGHVFGWVSPMMYLVFTLSFLNFNVLNNERIDLNEK